jgi:uncharacterized Zn finger protein
MKSGFAYAQCPVCGRSTNHQVAIVGGEVVGHCRNCRDTHMLPEPPRELAPLETPQARPSL